MKKIVEDSKAYLGSLRRYFVFVCAVYLASVILGLYFTNYSPEKAKEIFESLRATFSEKFLNLEPAQMALAIFFNNLTASFIIAFLGVFFGLLTVLGIAANGFVLGVVAFVTGSRKDLWLLLASTLPHGIVELPAFLLSAAIGIRLGSEALKKLLGREASLASELKKGLRFYLAFILPLLFLAAVIEVFVSLRIAKGLA